MALHPLHALVGEGYAVALLVGDIVHVPLQRPHHFVDLQVQAGDHRRDLRLDG